MQRIFKKILISILIIITCTGCVANTTIEIDFKENGIQSVYIDIDNYNLPNNLDNQETLDYLIEILESQKPIPEITFDYAINETTSQIKYQFPFDNLNDYQNKAFKITGREIFLTLDSHGNPLEGVITISSNDFQTNYFTDWVIQALKTSELFQQYYNPVELIFTNGEAEVSFNNSTLFKSNEPNKLYTLFKQDIHIYQLDIKTIIQDTKILRTFKYTYDNNLIDLGYLDDYLTKLTNSITFINKDTRLSYVLNTNEFIIFISTKASDDISLLVENLFDTSSYFETIINSAPETDYSYNDYFYPGVSIFGDIDLINYEVKLPTNAKTKTFEKINYENYDQYYGLVDYQENKIFVNDAKQAIKVEMTYTIVNPKKLKLNNILKFILLIIFLILLWNNFKNNSNKDKNLNDNQSKKINISTFKNLLIIKDKTTWTSTFIFMFCLFTLSLIFINLIIDQLQVIFKNFELLDLYESFDFIKSGKIDLIDIIYLIPTIYGIKYNLNSGYFDSGNIHIVLNIMTLILIPLISMIITNIYLKSKQIKSTARYKYLFQASSINSILLILIIIFKNVQMSNELEVLNYSLLTFIIHSIIINLVSSYCLIFLKTKIFLTKFDEIFKSILLKIIPIIIISTILLIPLYLHLKLFNIYPFSVLNTSIFTLLLSSGGFIDYFSETKGLLSFNYFITFFCLIQFIIITYALRTNLKHLKKTYQNLPNHVIIPLICLFYTILIYGLSYFSRLYLNSFDEIIGVLPNKLSLISVFILNYSTQMLLNQFFQYKTKE